MFDTQRFTEEIRHLSLRALRELATSVISQHFQGYRASELMLPWSLLFEECERRSPSSRIVRNCQFELVPTALWAVCMRSGRVKSQPDQATVNAFLWFWSKTKETVQ